MWYTYDSVQMARLLGWYLAKRESAKNICIKDQTSAAACWEVPTLRSPCEKPTPTGWSINSTLASLFHEKGLSVTDLLSLVIRQGPSSWSKPSILELPGWWRRVYSTLYSEEKLLKHTPPLNQRARGALSGSVRDSKNQNLNRWSMDEKGIEGKGALYQILSVAVKSPYPDTWLTPGVVSSLPCQRIFLVHR